MELFLFSSLSLGAELLSQPLAYLGAALGDAGSDSVGISFLSVNFFLLMNARTFTRVQLVFQGSLPIKRLHRGEQKE